MAERAESGGARGAPRLPWWKKLLFSAVVVAVFFGAIELVLWVAGVRPLLYDEDPYVGFSDRVPLFVEAPGSGGDQLVTARNKLRFFNRQQFAAAKPDGVTRIFCLGGSTTYGRPYDDATSFCGWLRELLPAADPGRRWEVINAGGISYASYRVAALAEELAGYQPDLFIVYTGHNEFLERRTYAGIIDTPAPLRGLAAALSHTRTYSAAVRATRRLGGGGGGGEAARTELAGEVEAILDRSVGPQDYQRDPELEEQVLAHYRFNLARLDDIARAAGARLVLVTPASNLRACSPFKSQHRDGLDAAQLEQWQALFDGASADLAAGAPTAALDKLDRAAAIDDLRADLHYLRGRALDALGRFAEAKLAYQRARDEDVCPLRALSPIPAIVREVAAQRGVPVVDFAALVEAAAPEGIPGDEHFLDHVHPTIGGHRMLALALVDAMAELGALEPAPAWGDAAVERVAAGIMARVDEKAQGVAMRNLSKVFSWAGKIEDAYRAAKKAQELFPGDAETHYQVGNLAARLGKDEEAIERLGHLVGVDLPADVGFYVKAHSQLATLLAEQGDYDRCEQVLAKLLRLDPAHQPGRQQWADLLTRRGKQLLDSGDPRAAAAKLTEAVRTQPDDFDANLQLAVALVRCGDHAAAAPALERLIALRPDYLPAYNNLSFVLAQLGRTDEAEQACRRALAIDPTYEPAQRNLQLILRQKAGGG